MTDDGIFLSGSPLDLVAKLGALTRVGAGRASLGDRGSVLMQLECDRIGMYHTQIGPRFAEFAASRLLENLEEEGLILIQH